MTRQSGYQGKAKEISLGEDFGDIAVKVNGVRVEVTRDGNVTVCLVANDDAKEYAALLDAHGHQDWRVPTKGEPGVLFNNHAAIGGFDVTGSFPAGWYWSTHANEIYAWGQRFSDGRQDYYLKGSRSAVRCVR